jgi:hypothetical protein
MNTLAEGAAIALIFLSILAPISYCTRQSGPSDNDLHLACITAKGEWKSANWHEPYVCSFPREKP